MTLADTLLMILEISSDWGVQEELVPACKSATSTIWLLFTVPAFNVPVFMFRFNQQEEKKVFIRHRTGFVSWF